MTEAYPLAWPVGVPRTRYPAQSAFGEVTIHRATQELLWEIERMGGRSPVVSTNLELRGDGLPYSKQRPITDHGVAVYFTRKGHQMVFACDRWSRIEHNMRAITKTIEAMRGIERWGSSDLMERAFAGFEALPAPDPWWKILGLPHQNVTRAQIADAYRRASQSAHPDRPGGSHDKMAAINAARAVGLARFDAIGIDA
jgi:hypothetical protein